MPYIPPQYDFHGNSTALTGSNPSVDPNSALMSFEDYYHQYTGHKVNPYGLAAKFDDFFTGKTSSAKQAYETYKAQYELEKNKQLEAERNALTWAREDSSVQRLMADYQKAGLNPYLLLSGGNLSSGISNSQASAASYKRSSEKSKSSINGKEAASMVTSAIKAIALIAMLAG